MKSTKQKELFETIKLQAWNIRVLPTIQGVYKDLFKFAYKTGEIKMSDGHAIKVRSIIHYRDQEDIFSGEFIYYSTENELEVYDVQGDKVEYTQLSEGLYLSPKTAQFYFVPSVHRLCTEVKSSKKERIPSGIIESYLKKVLNLYIENKGILNDHTGHVTPVTDVNTIKEILSRTDIIEIRATISYTNDDQTEDYEKLLDRNAREMKSATIDISAKSQRDVPLQPKGTIMEGALRLAQQNGSAVVKCKSSIGQTKTYSTKKFPLIEEFMEPSEIMYKRISDWLLSKFRDKEE